MSAHFERSRFALHLDADLGASILVETYTGIKYLCEPGWQWELVYDEEGDSMFLRDPTGEREALWSGL